MIWKAYFLTLEKFYFKKRKDCATIKSKYVTGDCEGIDFVIRTIFPMFVRNAARFGEVQMHDKGCLGTLGISFGNRQRWYRDVPARHN